MGRNFHAYAIGSGKTGTASIAAMFSKHYRSAHEPLPALTNQLVIEYDRGDLHPDAAATLFWARDQDLDLEMDASHPLGFIAPVFAQAIRKHDLQFIVTIRNPVTWIRSRIKYHYTVKPPAWEAFRHHFWWGWPFIWGDEDHYLYLRYGLCPVASYFKAYEKQYRLIKTHLPPERYLLIATETLNESVSSLARFLGIPPKTIEPQHVNQSPAMFDPSQSLEDGWLSEMAEEHCPTALEMWRSVK